jgi:serine/threonine protein kinase
MPAISPGSTIGAYELIEEIGRGGLGIVYRGRHVHLDRAAALKVLHPHWTLSSEFVERFQDEGRMMALLEHPNILRVYDAGSHEGVFFLAMSYLEGLTLERRLSADIGLNEALEIAGQLANALAYAHQRGIIHRDVKPANIMLGVNGIVTLMDFGVARLRDSPGSTLPGVRVGTPYYMAPEQIMARPVDVRADVYSLGVVLHQMLSGSLPFPGPTTDLVYDGHIQQAPPPLGPEVPEWLQVVVRTALAKRPEDRYSDAAALAAALRARQPTPAPAPKTYRFHTADAPETAPDPQSLTRKDRTALALDVVDSTQLKHPGQTLVAQAQFSTFRKFVRQYLDRQDCEAFNWSGDGLLALFRRPSDAVDATRQILADLDNFNGQHPESLPIRVRIGIHHGSILMAAGQPLGELVSRALDIAGHLQKASPENKALTTEPTLRMLDAAAACSWHSHSGLSRVEHPVYEYRPGAPPPPVLHLEIQERDGLREQELTGDAILGRVDPISSARPDVAIAGDDAVSRRHARFALHDGQFQIEDLDSANGTRLNDLPLDPGRPVALCPGDRIVLGEHTLIRIL